MSQPPILTKYDLGGAIITILNGGALRLDGGAMFGIIPRPLWSRMTPPDEQHRIDLACNCVLVEWPGSDRRVIIETGHGNKYEEKECRIYGINPSNWLEPTLTQARIPPDSITDVIMSHLHFDHAGGLTTHRDGRLCPTFPTARVHAQRREFDDARRNFGIMTMTYREENYLPIDEAGAWRLIDGETEIIPAPRPGLASIHARPTPGHTFGHHSIVIRGSSRTAVFVGDVMPTHAHLGAPYNMAYDLLPLENRESKRRLLTDAADQQWLLLLDHDPRTQAVEITRQKDWFIAAPAAGAAR